MEKSFKLPSPLPSWPTGGGFATGTINLGGLEVCQISSFTRIWATREGGQANLGATFYTPSQIPTGFFIFGSYCQENSKPLFGWVLAGKGNDDTGGALQKPVDYILVWSSASSKIKQDGHGYIWQPKAPQGYVALGHLVTSSPEKPSIDEVRCVRSDLTDACEKDSWLWGPGKKSGPNVYGLRPTNRGAQAPGVAVGTFVAQEDKGATSSISSLACLKNKDLNLSPMPNLAQIEALMQAYSPWIYFHPDEIYFPSSVTWYFNNGALLYKQGDPTPIPVDPTGSNLPQGGTNDGTYWLDLPVDPKAREKVSRGELETARSYLHVKPMLGGTFTDLGIWVFYPFNGPARAKAGFVTIPLGKTGGHVGDWEHLTLRISNFSGVLWRVYFSEHSGGKWVDASGLEFKTGNKAVAYSSLHGHALYPREGIVLQGNSQLGVGIRNDTKKGGAGMDTGVGFELVSAEYLGSVEEPPWLKYARKWGPKISYSLNELVKFLPGEGSLVKALPAEILGEDGPTGPKMKRNWNGDEV